MNEINAQKVLDVLNNLEVIEANGGDDPYLLVENNKKNRNKLNEVGINNETINLYGDDETFCILALAFNEGYADWYFNRKFFKSQNDIEIYVDNERENKVVLFKSNEEYFLGLITNGETNRIIKLSDSQREKIKEVLS
ncbi:MAG TPA: hypothetical protein VIK94_01025 [Bacilli bacterium]